MVYFGKRINRNDNQDNRQKLNMMFHFTKQKG